MIIRQTTTIVFEYPQDYLQEQEWCKTKEERWIHKSTDTLGAVYENTISYSIGQPKTEPQTDCNGCIFVGTYDTEFPCANCSRKTKDYYAKTEPQTEEEELLEIYGFETERSE